MGVSLLWSGAVQPSEIQPLRIVSAGDPVAPIERARPVDQAVSGERDLNVEVTRSPLLETQTPPIDQERVDSISEAIASGSYRLRPDLIADALIAAHRPTGDAA